jgi:mRNA interferase MazF
MRRGDVIIVSAKGDYGKPRPGVVIQNDRLEDWVESVAVCFLTSDLANNRNLRVTIEPEVSNGLREVSQVQVEKIMTFPKEKIRGPVGRLSPEQMRAVDRGLLILFDLLPPIDIPRTS